MDFDFSYGNDEPKDTSKKVKLVGGIVLGVLGLASLLFGLISVGNAKERERCLNVANSVGINVDRCENKFSQIIFVVGDTANTPVPSISEIENDIIDSLYRREKDDKDSISVISVSDPDASPISIKKKKAKEVGEAIKKMAADKDGADYLEAIRTAARYAKDKEKTLIYVIGSGLSDEGLLNFADNDLLVNEKLKSEEIANKVLSELNRKNELEGITVYWHGLGDVAAPQINLLADLKDKESNIYKEILLGMGAGEFVDSSIFSSIGINSNVKTHVKVTPIKKGEITFILMSDTSELAFIPGTSNFKSLSAARSIINRIVNENSNSTFIIEPFVSRGMCNQNASNHKELLKARAEATKKLFIETGKVSTADIVLKDGGLGDPGNGKESGECPNGFGNYAVDESVAPNNRKVVITAKGK